MRLAPAVADALAGSTIRLDQLRQEEAAAEGGQSIKLTHCPTGLSVAWVGRRLTLGRRQMLLNELQVAVDVAALHKLETR